MGLWVCKQRQPIFLEPFHVPHANATVLPAKDTAHLSPLTSLGGLAAAVQGSGAGASGRGSRSRSGVVPPPPGGPPLRRHSQFCRFPGATSGSICETGCSPAHCREGSHSVLPTALLSWGPLVQNPEWRRRLGCISDPQPPPRETLCSGSGPNRDTLSRRVRTELSV